MHDWTGSTIHRFPAHTKRITLARNPDAKFTPERPGPYIPREDIR